MIPRFVHPQFCEKKKKKKNLILNLEALGIVSTKFKNNDVANELGKALVKCKHMD
jgi:hypothetical protein